MIEFNRPLAPVTRRTRTRRSTHLDSAIGRRLAPTCLLLLLLGILNSLQLYLSRHFHILRILRLGRIAAIDALNRAPALRLLLLVKPRLLTRRRSCGKPSLGKRHTLATGDGNCVAGAGGVDAVRGSDGDFGVERVLRALDAVAGGEEGVEALDEARVSRKE